MDFIVGKHRSGVPNIGRYFMGYFFERQPLYILAIYQSISNSWYDQGRYSTRHYWHNFFNFYNHAFFCTFWGGLRSIPQRICPKHYRHEFESMINKNTAQADTPQGVGRTAA